MHYQVNLLKDNDSPGPLNLLEAVREGITPALAEQGIGCFGVFQGLFGLASNELYVVLNHDGPMPDVDVAFDQFERVSAVDLEPTVRPTDHSPRIRDGIYVFRWFEVHMKDVDEIAALSNTAWETFETGFATEVQGLFAQPDRSVDRGRMLLITWYEDLNAWQDSRRPAPEARENFMRRHQLTLEAFPVATRLVSGNQAPVIPGGQNRFS